MKKYILLIALLNFIFCLNAQNVFTKTYGTTANEYGANAVLTKDGGYALLITQTDSFDIYKTDSLGNVQWKKDYPIGTVGNMAKIIQTSDAGYAVIGETNFAAYNSGNYSSGVAIKFDSVGNILWHTSLVGSSSGENAAFDITQNINGEYICAAVIQHHPDFGGANYFAAIVKLSTTGVIQWSHAINNSNGGAAGVLAIDTSYYITGSINGVYGANNYQGNIFLAKYNNSGTQLWLKNYAYAPVANLNQEKGQKVKVLSGGFAIAGWSVIDTNNRAVIIKTDTSGNEIWHSLYGGYPNNERFFDLMIPNDGNIVATGYFDTVLIVQKVSSIADTIIWNETYGNGNGNSINICSNNDILIFGSTINHGAGGSDAWLLRLNSWGTQTTCTATITPNDTTLCVGNSIKLSAVPGYVPMRFIRFESYYSGDNGQVDVDEIQAYSNGINVALNKPGYASSYGGGGGTTWLTNGYKVDDGNTNSRYASNRNTNFPSHSSPVFIVIDLQSVYNQVPRIDSIIINIHDYIQSFELKVSTDTINWTVIATDSLKGVFTYSALDTFGMKSLWSTGDTTLSIIVNPTHTTTYSYSSTQNGLTCNGHVTITPESNPTASISGNLNFCSNQNTVLTAIGGNSYLWSNGATTSYISATLAQQYSVVATNLYGCKDTAFATTYIVDTLTWTGAADNDWHKPCNWSPSLVPSCCNKVVIPVTLNQPVVSGVAGCKKIIIYSTSGALLTVNTGANLQINQCPDSLTYNICPSRPTVFTLNISDTTISTGTGGGNVTYIGSSPVTARGVCWSINPNPNVTNSKTSDSSGLGSYNSSITGLLPGTTYYVRAYAINSTDTSYGAQVSFTTDTLTIGATYQGGIIIYIDGTRQHGLLAAPSNQGSAQWGCYGIQINGANGTAIGTGSANTSAIVSLNNSCNQGINYGNAAQICAAYTLQGYGGWYLPSIQELSLIGLGGSYWSSSQTNNAYINALYLNNGSQTRGDKRSVYAVRAIRNF